MKGNCPGLASSPPNTNGSELSSPQRAPRGFSVVLVLGVVVVVEDDDGLLHQYLFVGFGLARERGFGAFLQQMWLQPQVRE